MRPLSAIKNLLVSKGRAPRRILSGAFKGLKLDLDLAFQTQVYLGLAERETHRWIERLSEGVASAVDIGAAEGEYALYFLARTNAKKIYGFEPSEQSTAVFLSNLRLNGFERDTRLSLSSLFVGDKDSLTMRTLDSLLSEIKPPLLVKVDVDGAEMDVLRGASRLLAEISQ
jgi:Methyltransferase FkbM domain